MLLRPVAYFLGSRLLGAGDSMRWLFLLPQWFIACQKVRQPSKSAGMRWVYWDSKQNAPTKTFSKSCGCFLLFVHANMVQKKNFENVLCFVGVVSAK